MDRSQISGAQHISRVIGMDGITWNQRLKKAWGEATQRAVAAAEHRYGTDVPCQAVQMSVFYFLYNYWPEICHLKATLSYSEHEYKQPHMIGNVLPNHNLVHHTSIFGIKPWTWAVGNLYWVQRGEVNRLTVSDNKEIYFSMVFWVQFWS